MSCWFSQSHLLKKILYTELKETDFIKLQLDCQLSNRLIPVLQAPSQLSCYKLTICTMLVSFL